ncbi:MAG: phosphatidylserine decarboxylase [Lentisphaeria bacterium]|nr:phosphatidylserine decarboxylase [Lentisphaeria bacterium]
MAPVEKKAIPHQVFDPRSDRLITEKVCGQKLIQWAYTSPAAPLFKRLIFRNSLGSRLLGRYFDSRFSRRKIPGFAREFGIDMSEVDLPEKGFTSFNHFFSRSLKPGSRPFSSSPETLICPADCRALVFPDGLTPTDTIPVKGLQFSIPDLLSPPPDAPPVPRELAHGHVVVCRLCPADYHRYHFPAAGRVLSSWRVEGSLHSVNPLPLSLGVKVFTENTREVSVLQLERFGLCAFVEVGAFGVGRIKRTHTAETFQKMDEKGYFQFGGSTVVMVLPPGTVTFRDDLCHWSKKGVEVLCKTGDSLGVRQPTRHP